MPKLSANEAFVHPGCMIVNSSFGGWCEVGEGSRVLNSTFEDYAYCDRLSDIANTTLGKFANIAALTRIGPTDHPMANASLHHFLYRSSSYWDDMPDDAPELLLATLLERYRRMRMDAMTGATKQQRTHFELLTTQLQQRLLSSVEAFARSLRVH